MNKIYFDYAATSPCDPEVIKAMAPYHHDVFGNPLSPHSLGRDAMKAVDDSRERLASFIGAKPNEIHFTSGATESNNQVLFSITRSVPNKGNHIIISSVEHQSVLEPIEYLKTLGFKITYLDVDQEGFVNPLAVKDAITDKTILISVMHANNEIGTIQPIGAIGRIAHERKIPFLVDCVQTLGHIPVNVKELDADFISLSAHKFCGPKGVGALYVREGARVLPLIWGGGQERNLRGSTHNVAGIVGLGKAVELCRQEMGNEALRLEKMRNRLFSEIPKLVNGVKINGSLNNRLPFNAHFSFERISGESLLMSLDMAGIAASMGSACSSGAMEVSHVLRAIGLSDNLALGSLRLTLGRWSKDEEIDHLFEVLPAMIRSLRI